MQLQLFLTMIKVQIRKIFYVVKICSVSAPKLRCPSSARLATFPARLGSGREISARTHHYYISLFQMQFNDKKGSLVANDEGEKNIDSTHGSQIVK